MPTKPLMVINVVGLTHEMIGPHTPQIQRVAEKGFARPMGTVLPAVTCTAQSTLLTGTMPSEHGIVGNGWYDRELAEVMFWKQSNHLVHGERVYQAARKNDGGYSTAKMFWWYNMYAPVEWSMTPRPSYPADGRKVFDSYSHPPELRDELQADLGKFPLHHFWGPGADILSSTWIADASVRVWNEKQPSLMLVYLPHLDYNLQRLGPNDPEIVHDIQAVDAEAGKLIAAAEKRGAEVVVLSEYAITQVDQPVHLNRVLRECGYLQTRWEPLGWETLDCGASRAFAVADHQVAHVYLQKEADLLAVKSVLENCSGVERVLDRQQQAEFGIDHPRSGDLVCIADSRSWFTYYFWMDDQRAPDYARTIDIHRKPGYDPVELFVDPKIRFPKLRIANRLARKILGFRYYMDLIGLDASRVKGSHGRLPTPGNETTEAPVFVSSVNLPNVNSGQQELLPMTAVKELLLEIQFG